MFVYTKAMKALVAALMLTFPAKFDQKQVDCLAHAVYHEARGESIEGQEAVAHVVLNRTESGEFPDTICEVVYQPKQFSNIKQTKPKKSSEAWETAREVSVAAIAGVTPDPTRGGEYFYAQKVVKPKWARNKEKVTIGNHTFLLGAL